MFYHVLPCFAHQTMSLLGFWRGFNDEGRGGSKKNGQRWWIIDLLFFCEDTDYQKLMGFCHHSRVKGCKGVP